MTNAVENRYIFDVLDDSLLDLYDEQFKYTSLKAIIESKTKESNEILNKLINQFKQSNEADNPKLVVDLSDEQKNKYKNGLLTLDKNKNGEMYAQLRDENGKYSNKLTIKEETAQTDLLYAAQLNTIKDVLVEIVDVLEDIENSVNEVLSGLHNDRLGLYYSGIGIYLEAMHTEDSVLQKLLIAQAIKSLSDAQAQIIQEFKSDILYLQSTDFQKIKKKRHDCLVEKMQNIHECFQTINRIISIKAMIYLDENQFNSVLMTCTEYQRFINAIVKPNASFLIECDPRDDKLINGIWSKRANTFIRCKEIREQLRNNSKLLITMEDK